MDKKLEKKELYKKKKFWICVFCISLFLIFTAIMAFDSPAEVNIEKDKITISEVRYDDFEEFISVTGTVLAKTTIFLDAIAGGSVEKVFAEEGSLLKAGEKILKLSNTSLQLSTLQQETGTYQQINEARNTRLLIEQNSTSVQSALVGASHSLNLSRQAYMRGKAMWVKKLISDEEYERLYENYARDLQQQKLAYRNYAQDSVLKNSQLTQIDQSIKRLQLNLELIRENIDNLIIRSPIDGQLTSLDAEAGQSKPSGSRLGQIDALDGFRISADIDEFYISRITAGLSASAELNGSTYRLLLTKVLPEISAGRFRVYLYFTGSVPGGLRRGQTLQLKLKLSEKTRGILIPRGGFFQKTGGQWVFCINEKDNTAYRKKINIGRQNPDYYEVLSGLKPGEKVITSSYENFGDARRLALK